MVVGGLLIREYEAKDHGFVCKLFSDALFENWGPAYRWELLKFCPLEVCFYNDNFVIT